KQQVHIEIIRKFAAADSALQGLISLQAPRHEEAVAKRLDQFRIRLTTADQGGYDAAAATAQYANQLFDLQANIGAHRTGIRETQLIVGTLRKSVSYHCRLVWPPTIDRSLAHIGITGNRFHGEIWKTSLLQQLQRTAQDGLTRFFAAGTTGRP